jgi:hypothetical protein
MADFNALVSTKAAALKAWRAANTATKAAQAAFTEAEVAAGIKRRPPTRPVRPVPHAPAPAPAPVPAPAPPPPPDWAALGAALTSAIAAEAPLQAAYLAAKKVQDDEEKAIGAQ